VAVAVLVPHQEGEGAVAVLVLVLHQEVGVEEVGQELSQAKVAGEAQVRERETLMTVEEEGEEEEQG